MKLCTNTLLFAGLLISAMPVGYAQNSAVAPVAAPVGNSASTLRPFVYAGASAISNSPGDIHSTTLWGGVIGGGVVWRERHLFSVQTGYFSGDYSKASFVPTAGEGSETIAMDPEHACCSDPVLAAPDGYDYEYHFKHDSAWVPLFVSYNYIWNINTEQGLTLRAGPTAGFIFVSNEITESVSEKVAGYLYHRSQKISKNSFIYGGGAEVALGWNFNENWAFEAGYRFFATPSYSVVKDWKSGVNLNHQFVISVAWKF